MIKVRVEFSPYPKENIAKSLGTASDFVFVLILVQNEQTTAAVPSS